MKEEILDTSGTVCPMPAFKTKNQVKKMENGDRLVVKGDFIPAVENIIRIAEKNGCKLLDQVLEGETFEIMLEKQD